MDSFTTQISQLRTALTAALAQVDGLATAASAIPTATPVAAATAVPLVFPKVPTHPPGTAVGAGLPPTKGAQGPAEEEHPWRALADPHAGDSWRATAAALAAGAPPSTQSWTAEPVRELHRRWDAAVAALPPPSPIQAQQTLGVATPAKFGDAEANAQHYLSGIGLYEPAQELLEAEDAAYKAWREAELAALTAPHGKKGVLQSARRVAACRLREASEHVRAAKKLKERYQAYYDGTWAALPYCHPSTAHLAGKAYFIYRFYVFEELEGLHTAPTAWKPLGLLNPHAYNAAKAAGVAQSFFLDFVDASQPTPNVTAYWRAEWGEEDDDSLSSCSEDSDEDEDARDARLDAWAKEQQELWLIRGEKPAPGAPAKPLVRALPDAVTAQLEETRRALFQSAPAPAPASALPPLPPLEFQPDAPRHPPVLQRQDAVDGSAVSTPPVAVAPPALPRIAYPTLERAAGTEFILDSVVLGEKAMQYKAELKAYEAALKTGKAMLANGTNDWRRYERLLRAYEGGWTTLPDGRKAMLWAFHAFAPPADGEYDRPQPLVHLGLYNITDRSLDTTEAPPSLPKKGGDWPW